jgi:putative restriction endonuclease
VRVPLISPQGIFKPAILPEMPLSINTSPPVERRDRPYDDGFEEGGFLRYRYRGADPAHRDNVGLRLAMQRQTPLIYLHGIVPGLYEAAWPVFVVEDRPEALSFIVAIDDQVGAPTAWQFNDPAALTARRQYVTAVVRQRLHQRGFRQRVIRAYRQACAICRLRHDETKTLVGLLLALGRRPSGVRLA